MTNLIVCVQKPTPTGIDRIDLIYALFLIRLNWIDLRPVYVKGNTVYLISPNKLRKVSRRLLRIWAGKESPGIEGGIFDTSFQGLMLRWLHRKLRVKFNAPGKGYYINISQRNLANSGVIKWIKLKSCTAVCMIHDLLPITHHKYFDEDASVKHQEKLHAMLSAGAVMVCGSESCQSELYKFASCSDFLQINSLYASFGCKHLAYGSIDQSAESSEKPYFLMLGSFEPRKNHQFLLKVWLEMIERFDSEKVPNLIMTGRAGDISQTILQILLDEPKLAAKVSIISDASDSKISKLIKSAQAMLIPSIAEGYGLTLFEAFSHNTPVIAADIEIFQVLGQNIAQLVSLDRPDLWVDAIINFSPERERQKQVLKDWRRPTWASHFRKIISELSEFHKGQIGI